MKYFVGRVVLVAALLTPLLAAAQQGTPPSSQDVTVSRVPVKDWTYVCFTAPAAEGKKCRINSKIWADAEQKAMTAAIAVYRSEDPGKFIAMLRSGTGVDYARQVRVRVDDGTVYTLPPGECGDSECRTVFTLPDKMLADMKRGERIRFMVPIGDADQFVELSFSLIGFTRAQGMLISG